MLYCNYYGCDKYPINVYTNDPTADQGRLGGLTYCAHPRARPWEASIFAVTFIFLAGFCILALFIGVVTMSMAEGIKKIEAETNERKCLKKAAILTRGKVANLNFVNAHTRMILRGIFLAFQGLDIEAHVLQINDADLVPGYRQLSRWYLQLARRCASVAHHEYFKYFISACIIVASVEIGMEADGTLDSDDLWTQLISTSIQSVFLAECLLKIVAEELTPWTYFLDPWNVFDMAVAAGSFVSNGGNLVLLMRLLRIIRVIRLMRTLPQLQVIVSALVNGASSIGYATILLALFFYFFGVIGVTLFAENDPWRFGTLHFAMATLFQIITLDNWNDVLYTNMYGCDLYGYWYFPWFCTHPNPRLGESIVFFTVYIITGSMILLSLFIGVVTNSLEEAMNRFKEEQDTIKRARKIGVKYKISCYAMRLYHKLFLYMDLEKDGCVDKEELFHAVSASNCPMTVGELDKIWGLATLSKPYGLSFCDFLMLMLMLRKDRFMYFEPNDFKNSGLGNGLGLRDDRVILEQLNTNTAHKSEGISSGTAEAAGIEAEGDGQQERRADYVIRKTEVREPPSGMRALIRGRWGRAVATSAGQGLGVKVNPVRVGEQGRMRGAGKGVPAFSPKVTWSESGSGVASPESRVEEDSPEASRGLSSLFRLPTRSRQKVLSWGHVSDWSPDIVPDLHVPELELRSQSLNSSAVSPSVGPVSVSTPRANSEGKKPVDGVKLLVSVSAEIGSAVSRHSDDEGEVTRPLIEEGMGAGTVPLGAVAPRSPVRSRSPRAQSPQSAGGLSVGDAGVRVVDVRTIEPPDLHVELDDDAFTREALIVSSRGSL